MKTASLCFIIIFSVLHQTESTASQEFQHARTLLDSLADENWADDEEHCKEATFRLLNAARNHTAWAIWVWDSTQTPVSLLSGSRYHLGSFDQCLSDPWDQETMQFCLVDVKLGDVRGYEEVDPSGSVKEFVGVESKHGHRHLNRYSFSVCLPSVCSPSSVAKISRHFHHLTHLPFGDVTVDPRNCQRKETMTEFTLGFYVFWFVIILTAGITAAAYLFEDSINNTSLSTAASWFNPIRNYKALTATGKDEVTSLNGLRVFCMGTAIVMHYFYYTGRLATNAVDIAKDMETNAGKLMVQLAITIDTFFIMSGLLHATGLLLRSGNVLRMLLKRYLKLLIPFALSVLFMRTVLRHAGSGPLWPLLMKEQVDPCMNNGLPGLFMVNNFIRTEDICHMVTWYISCDFQLTVLGSMVFCFCLKAERRAVLAICSTLFLVASAVPVAIGYWYSLPPILVYDMESAIGINNKVLHVSYMKPYSRAAPYLIGMLLGYAMHIYQPGDYKKRITKRWSIVCGTLAFTTMFSIMFIGGYINHLPYNAGLVGAYFAVDRTIYAMGLCLLIVVCEYGTFPLVGDFFTSKVFRPLSRLSFGLYLYHPALICINVYSTRALFYYNFVNWIVNGLGYIVICFVISYFHWFIIDAPCSHCINYLLVNGKNRTSKAVTSENGKSD